MLVWSFMSISIVNSYKWRRQRRFPFCQKNSQPTTDSRKSTDCSRRWCPWPSLVVELRIIRFRHYCVQFFAYCVQLTGHNSPDLRIGLAWHSIAIFSILQYRCYCVQLTGHNKKIVKKWLFNYHLTQNIKYRLTSYHIRHTVK